MIGRKTGILVETILNVFKCLITFSTKTLNLAIPPVLFVSVGFPSDAPHFPDLTVKCPLMVDP